jgi:hypothetical protein
MEVNDGKGLGRLIIFFPQRTDNRVFEVNTQIPSYGTSQALEPNSELSTLNYLPLELATGG